MCEGWLGTGGAITRSEGQSGRGTGDTDHSVPGTLVEGPQHNHGGLRRI